MYFALVILAQLPVNHVPSLALLLEPFSFCDIYFIPVNHVPSLALLFVPFYFCDIYYIPVNHVPSLALLFVPFSLPLDPKKNKSLRTEIQ